jgi:hypothetical protein
MKKVFYLSLILIISLAGSCKKKNTTTPTPTPTVTIDPAPTMNYVKFTLKNGSGNTDVTYNKTFTYSKAKNFVQTYEYSQTTTGVIYAIVDLADQNGGDYLVQVHLDDNTTGNKPFSPATNAVYIKFLNLKTGFATTSTLGSFNIKAFAPTQLVTNMTSGTMKGKFSIDATFAGTMEEDALGTTWTMTGGELKMDGL